MLAQKKYDIELRKELSNLKEDMVELSMVDEFAKYAKLQRRCNHVESILKENSEFFVQCDFFLRVCCIADRS